MPKQRVADRDMIAAWLRLGSPELVAKEFDIGVRGVYARRPKLERRYSVILPSSYNDRTGRLDAQENLPKRGIRRIASIDSGRIIVFNDAHIWPNRRTLAMDKLVLLCRELKPTMVVANGDIFDGAKISSHPPNGWEDRAATRPEVYEEIEAVAEFMAEIRRATPKARHVWNLGNHDIRPAKYLAVHAPLIEKVKGTRLDDHVTGWDVGWSLMINDHTMIKHRWHGGAHALYNNVMKSGVSMVTGHLHQGEVRGYTDYRGKRYACDPGTMMDIGPESPQVDYTEDAPVNWSSGFALCTFDNGVLLRPELCEILNGNAYFRGARV